MEDISVQELKKRQADGEALNILDVREQWEYDEENMGARLIPLSDLPHRLSEIENWKNKELIVHCKSGNRAGQARKFLISKGFTNVRNLLGGLTAYQDE